MMFTTVRGRLADVTGTVTLDGDAPARSAVDVTIQARAGDAFKVVGDLTVRGVTREVVLDARFEGTGTDPWGNTRSGFSAGAVLDRRDFGLTWNQALEAGGVLVGHEVKIELQVQAVLALEPALV